MGGVETSDGCDDDDDFMSDKFLVDTATSSASSSKNVGEVLTYSERRRRALNKTYENGRTKSRAEREKEARRDGLGKSLLEVNDGDFGGGGGGGGGSKRKHEGETDGISDNKALRMMMSMGFRPGQSLGKQESGQSRNLASIQTEPLAIDERWLERGSRSGIGNLPKSSAIAIERDIRNASSSASLEQTNDDLESFRARARQSHDARHAESLLRSARKTCEDLDRLEMAMTYSPLWLDVASLFKRQDDLPQDVLGLISFAFAGLDDEKERNSVSQKSAEMPDPKSDAESEVKTHSSPDEEEGSSAAAVAVRIERAKIARSFCMLSVQVRLQITVSHLRRAHSYCLFCGHRYANQQELDNLCPGEEEDDH